MRNHEVTAVQPLLKADGSLREPGWSKQLYQVYDRSAIKAPKFRIKEWDYYLIISEKNNFGVALTISDDGYIGLQSATLLDFSIPWEHTETILNAFPMGKFKLPSTSARGNTVYHDKRLDMEFRVSNGQRRLICNFKNFHEGKTFSCDITLAQPEMDTMVIATPWKENKKAFYYNQKINCMRASGYAEFDGVRYEFNPETDFGTLDWGRGVWTYDNTWNWGSGNAVVNGKPFGFNIGYGFGYQQFLIGNIGRAEFADDYVAKERGYCVNLISISILGCGVDYACHSVEYFGNFHFDGCRNEIFYMRFVVQVGYNVEYYVYY